mmetsp:Transcript_29811/g.73251  ORF Transcript_29811/g.73251 Transcript_29811/m.73251 type:complete len:240 (-) Transcript_29811:1364-2083(-)
MYATCGALKEEAYGIVKAILDDGEVVQSPDKTVPRAGSTLEFEEIEIGMRVRPVEDVHTLRALCERVPEGATNCVSWNEEMASIVGANFIVVAKRARYQAALIKRDSKENRGSGWLVPFEALRRATCGLAHACLDDVTYETLQPGMKVHVKPSFEEVKSACNERAPGAESEDIVHWTEGMIDTIGQEFTVKRLIPAMNAVQMELRKKGEFFFPENMRTGWIFPFHALCRKSLYSARPHY